MQPIRRSVSELETDNHNERDYIYVTNMLRWGSTENHSYILGVYSTYEIAKEKGLAEVVERGGKYEAEVIPIIIDSEDMNWRGIPVSFNTDESSKEYYQPCSRKCISKECNLSKFHGNTQSKEVDEVDEIWKTLTPIVRDNGDNIE